MFPWRREEEEEEGEGQEEGQDHGRGFEEVDGPAAESPMTQQQVQKKAYYLGS